jgi:hypothetical protein
VAFTTDVAPAQLKQLLEHSVSANLTPAGTLQAEGRFGQVSEMNLVYDPSQRAQQVVRNADGTATITSEGSRVRQLTLTLNDDDPSNDVVVVRNGVVVPGAPASIWRRTRSPSPTATTTRSTSPKASSRTCRRRTSSRSRTTSSRSAR